MFRRIARMIALACFALSLIMCGGTPETPEPPDATRPEAPPSKNEPEPALPDEEPTLPPAEQEPEPVTPPAAEPAPLPVEPTPPPAEQEPEPVTPPAAEPAPLPAVSDPGGLIEVEATKDGVTDIGSEKCKICHKVQFASWSESAHARRTPPLDCESCHGPGSEYKTMSAMKDPEKADAAGLVRPGKEFCSICHKSGWSDEMLGQAHAHKDAG